MSTCDECRGTGMIGELENLTEIGDDFKRYDIVRVLFCDCPVGQALKRRFLGAMRGRRDTVINHTEED